MDKNFNVDFDKLSDAKKGGLSFFVFITLLIIINFIGSLIAIVFNFNYAIKTYVSSIFSSIAFFIYFLLFRKKINYKTTFLTNSNKFNPVFILSSLFLSIFMICSLGFLNNSVAQLVIKLGGKINSVNITLNNFGDLIYFLVTIAILPAFFEECFFRGVILSSFNKSNNIIAILFSSLCFALYHGSIAQLFYQFLYGIFLAYLFIKTKNLLFCMFSHFLNNAIVLICMYVKYNIDFYNIYVILIGLISFVLFILSLIVFSTNKKIFNKQSDKNCVKEFILPFGLCGVVFCLILIISNLFI